MRQENYAFPWSQPACVCLPAFRCSTYIGRPLKMFIFTLFLLFWKKRMLKCQKYAKGTSKTQNFEKYIFFHFSEFKTALFYSVDID